MGRLLNANLLESSVKKQNSVFLKLSFSQGLSFRSASVAAIYTAMH